MSNHFGENGSVETLREAEECEERREGEREERRERERGGREKEEQRLQQPREILSILTGPFHSNFRGLAHSS